MNAVDFVPICDVKLYLIRSYQSRLERRSGLSFKDSDEIISRLSHVDSRQLLHENSQEALQLGASSAPFFASSSGEPTVTFSDFHDFKNFVIGS
ncbi:hypothetical protein COOONC_20877 [Cooperia oncophora]